MTRRVGVGGVPGSAGRLHLWLAGALFLGLVGCSHNALTRGQTEDEPEHDRYAVKTVGDVTVVGNAEPVALGGVGLIVGLEGTGGDSPADAYRAMMVTELQRQHVKNVKDVLSSPNHALVIIEGSLPPGAAKDDPIDLEIKLPPGSKATSLRGGYLKKAYLFNYDTARHLSPNYSGNANMLMGHKVATAEGAILVNAGLSDADEGAALRQGRIWGGGRSRVDQPFGLMMSPDSQKASISALVAERINETFHGGVRNAVENKVAIANNNIAISLRVPSQYRHNLQRYLRVVRLVPMGHGADVPTGEGALRHSYRQRLEADVLDPAHTVVAALRLEALGTSSIPGLKKGLKHAHPLVRFCCAESLAYLGSPTCGEELGKAVVQQPLFRAFALTALASLDEAVAHTQLRELMHTAGDDETRIGAFRALRVLDERDPAVAGELLNESFWLHCVESKSEPMVHFSTTKRAEVVLFGEAPRLSPPFSFLAGEFVVTATADDRIRCTVGRFPRGGAVARKQCGLELEAVLRAMADLGASYPEVIALLQQAHGTAGLTCRVRCDALPQATSVYELVRIGQGKGDAELLPGGQDLGVTPTLYESGISPRASQARQREAMLRDRQASAPAQPE